MTERDVETICRAILVYCLLHYRGDENIKSFIWDLISPAENGKTKELQNHSGNYQLLPFHLSTGYLVLFRCKGFSQSKSLMSPLPQVCLSLCPVGERGKKWSHKVLLTFIRQTGSGNITLILCSKMRVIRSTWNISVTSKSAIQISPQGRLAATLLLKCLSLPSRVLLRVRMLYYLRQEVIGDQAEKVLGGAIAR